MIIIHGYHKDKDDISFSEKDIRDNIFKLLDGRSNIQLITSTWFLPENWGYNGKKIDVTL